MSDKTADNRRILIIDDNVSIHDDFRIASQSESSCLLTVQDLCDWR